VWTSRTTFFRWTQTYASAIEQRIRPHLWPSNGTWQVDKTYVRVKGRWMHLYRAVDSRGQTIDFLLSAKRDAEAAKRFFCKALVQPHTVNGRSGRSGCRRGTRRGSRISCRRGPTDKLFCRQHSD
jgi:transposase-like protein